MKLVFVLTLASSECKNGTNVGGLRHAATMNRRYQSSVWKQQRDSRYERINTWELCFLQLARCEVEVPWRDVTV